MPAPQRSTSTSEAIMRGFAGRCPNCGEGRLFRKFLRVKDHCDVCGEAFFHHRADDFPAYIVVLITGHVLVPLICAVNLAFAVSEGANMLIWCPVALVIMLGLLQPVKGAVVAMQWKLGMHGFGEGKDKAP